jgi:hypothetical protein
MLFDSKLKMAPSQAASARLLVKLGSRLRYDYPNKRQRWEYWDVEDPSERPIFAETWINFTLFELDLTTDPPGCTARCEYGSWITQVPESACTGVCVEGVCAHNYSQPFVQMSQSVQA